MNLLRPAVSFLVAALCAAPVFAQVSANASNHAVLLNPDDYRHYTTEFMKQEVEATGEQAADPWPWMQANIPWFDSSEKSFEEMYYFRWYAFQKHVVSTPAGYVITEFLPHVGWGGYFNTIADSAPHHLYEARWLRDSSIAEDDARFWMSSRAVPRQYSDWMADAIRAVTLANGDRQLGIDLLPALEANYQAWEQTHQDSNGLFWSIDTRDAMEKSISGSGYRPTLNSYLYGDAAAIAAIAHDANEPAVEKEFDAKAAAQRTRVEEELWNPRDQFYEVRTPRGMDSHFADVRELIGYIPWYFNIPAADHAAAWKQLFDPRGFAGKYGPTTAERRSPRFRFPNPDKCQWNGPSWPFATTQTLVAMANVENDQPDQTYATHADYYHLFSEYVLSQHLRLANGDVIPWIDEDLDADTDEWIARDILIQRHNSSAGRGNYYNHSGFADPLITGLIGLRPREDNTIVLHPLLPANTWTYFAMDGLPWHGHLLTIVYDQTGEHYHRGRGLTLFVDGQKMASRKTLGNLEYQLKDAAR
jgi:hypothetical protein